MCGVFFANGDRHFLRVDAWYDFCMFDSNLKNKAYDSVS